LTPNNNNNNDEQYDSKDDNDACYDGHADYEVSNDDPGNEDDKNTMWMMMKVHQMLQP